MTFMGHGVADYDVPRTELAYRRHVILVGACGLHWAELKVLKIFDGCTLHLV